MKLKLKRKYAYLCLFFFVAGVVCLWLPFLFISSEAGKYCVIVGSILILCALGIKYILLKCPCCGYGGLVPQLHGNDNYHCPKCGKKVLWE